jgi:glutamate-1-semialdehyde 2,1-aminomutase
MTGQPRRFVEMQKEQDALIAKYVESHPGSQKLHEQAARLFAANGATHAARVMQPFRPYITHAKGSRKWDVDGNEYIDFVMGHGTLLLGHSHPNIVQALEEQIAKGLLYGDNHELEVEWATLIQQMMPVAERVEFCACGQEANMMAIWLSRVFTGRKKVLRFVDNFHGWGEEVVRKDLPGVIAENVDEIPFNDVEAVAKALATRQYAILMTEGGGAHMAGQVPIWDELLYALPDLTRESGTVWLIDEVVTGFRDAPGGWQSLKGVKPDLTTVGKCVGGGLSIGALLGRADIMQALSPQAASDRRIAHSGTWNANAAVAAAGVAACKLYQDGAPQEAARARGTQLREMGNEALKSRGIKGRLYGRTIIHPYFGPIDFEPVDVSMAPTRDSKKITDPAFGPVRDRLVLHMLCRGVSILTAIGSAYLIMSAAHSEEDVEQALGQFASSLDAMLAEGAFPKVLLEK